jgi:hypothetical protein
MVPGTEDDATRHVFFEHSKKVQGLERKRGYTITVPLSTNFRGKYEVAMGHGEGSVPPNRFEVRVAEKRETEFDVVVTVWRGSNHQFQVECLAVRQ